MDRQVYRVTIYGYVIMGIVFSLVLVVGLRFPQYMVPLVLIAWIQYPIFLWFRGGYEEKAGEGVDVW